MAFASVVAAVLLVFAVSYRSRSDVVERSPAPPEIGGSLAHVALKVDGMTCATCSYRVNKALVPLSGVRKAEVSLERGQAVVTYEEGKVTVEQMIEAIEQAGYTAKLIRAGGR